MSNIDPNNYMLLVLYGGLIIVLIISSVTDLYQRRIPNLVTWPAVLMALLIYFLIGGLDGVLFSLGGLAFGFVIFLLPYLMGGMGAGDVKLMCAVGSVLGFRHTIGAFLFIAIVGGVMALGLMLYRRILRQTLSKIFKSLVLLGVFQDISLLKFDKEKLMQDGIPFAVAITSGVCLFFIYLAVNKETLSVFGVL